MLNLNESCVETAGVPCNSESAAFISYSFTIYVHLLTSFDAILPLQL